MLTKFEIAELPFATDIQCGVNVELRRLIICMKNPDGEWIAGAINERDVRAMAAYFENMLSGVYMKQ